MQPGTPPRVLPPGFARLVTAAELDSLRAALARGQVPLDLENKLACLANGNLVERYVEQNARLFVALLAASGEGAYSDATPTDRERLLRVLAYIRKDDDEIPDYRPGGFFDDQQEVRAFVAQHAALLNSFKSWRLTHQVPAMW
jgi:hypothetical protein